MVSGPVIKIKVTGIDLAMNSLKKAGRVGRFATREAVLKSGMEVTREAKKLCPVETGRLRASIGMWDSNLVKDNPDAGPEDAVWEIYERIGEIGINVGTNVDYAWDVETIPALHITGQVHYMEGGAQAAIPAIKKHFETAIRKIGGF